MKSLRCIGFSVLVFLSACDAEKPPAAPPKVAAAPVTETTVAPAAIAPANVPVEKPAALPVHELAPNSPAVKVVTASKAANASPASSDQKSSLGNAKSAKIKADNADIANRAPVASKTRKASQVVKETRLSKPSLDLSLPPEMVQKLTPPSQVITAANRRKAPSAGAKPLLPKMFQTDESEADFRLQGRLLSNEMQLQLRNDSRREVEGAAVDFTFKQ